MRDQAQGRRNVEESAAVAGYRYVGGPLDGQVAEPSRIGLGSVRYEKRDGDARLVHSYRLRRPDQLGQRVLLYQGPHTSCRSCWAAELETGPGWPLDPLAEEWCPHCRAVANHRACFNCGKPMTPREGTRLVAPRGLRPGRLVGLLQPVPDPSLMTWTCTTPDCGQVLTRRLACPVCGSDRVRALDADDAYGCPEGHAWRYIAP